MAPEAFALRGKDPNNIELAQAVGASEITVRRHRPLVATVDQGHLERRRSDGHLVTQHLPKPPVSESTPTDQTETAEPTESPDISEMDETDFVPNPLPSPAGPDYRTGPLPDVTGDLLNPAARAELQGFAADARGHLARAQGVVTKIVKDAEEPRLRMLLSDAETHASWEETATQTYALLSSMELLGIRPNQEKGVRYGQAYTR